MKHALALLLLPALAGAQDITLRTRGEGPAAALLDSVVARPHAVRTGTGTLEFPRDSVITTSLVVIGRPTYLASRVDGDVVVVGGDLYLRPGADIRGRAVAIGGTVSETTLGTVENGVRSLRDETFVAEQNGASGDIVLVARDLRAGGSDSLGVFRLAGMYGVLMPTYDRVDGLSLPVAVQAVLHGGAFVAQPSVTYRSRLGAFDPALSVRLGPAKGTRFVARVARDTRSNDAWITEEPINSLKTFAFGTDTRNWFRSDLAEARMFVRRNWTAGTFEPFAGVRYERVSPITAVGNVYSILSRTDSGKMRRPNPLVEPGHVASALLGAVYQTMPEDAPIQTVLRLDLEQSVVTPEGTGTFTQLTFNGLYEFPTFGTHELRFRGHAVGTLGGDTPMARYAYLGGSRTLGLSDLLEFGGDQLLFLDSRYSIPVERIQLPFLGAPVLELIHRIGGAGVGSVGPLEQEVGVGARFGPIVLDYVIGASGQGRSKFGVGVSLSGF